MRAPRWRTITVAVAVAAAAATVAIVGFDDRTRPVPAVVSSTPVGAPAAWAQSSTWPAGTVVIAHDADRVSVVQPDGRVHPLVPDSHYPVAALVPGGESSLAGSIQIADRESGIISVVGPDGELRRGPTVHGGLTAGAATPSGRTVWLDAVRNTVVFIDAAGSVEVSYAVGANPVRAVVAPPGTPRAGTVYVLSSGTGPAEPGSVTMVSPGEVPQRVSTGLNSTAITIAPAGGPNAGTVYVSNTGGGTLTVIRPDNAAIVVGGFTAPAAVEAAPAGGVGAGTVYLIDGQLLRVLDAQGRPIREIADLRPTRLTLAPGGTPLAGTVYVSGDQGDTVTAIDPATWRASTLATGRRPGAMSVAPAGTPNAGTVYIANLVDGTITAVAPRATSGETVAVGDLPIDIHIVSVAQN